MMIEAQSIIEVKTMKIAILYIGTGRYTIFWDEFFKSCEKYFIKDVQKHYFFFTDDKTIKSDDKVTVVAQDNLSWPMIACFRYKIINKIKEQLKDYDFVFFFNGNMEFVKPVTKEEFLPNETQSYLVSALHSINKRAKSNDEFMYERNPESTSFIPYGQGKYYLQSAISGGRTPEYLKLLKDCEDLMDKDLQNNFIPIFHDESLFNKYMLGKPHLVLGCNYMQPVHGKPWMKYGPSVKIIQRDKAKLKYGGHSYLRGECDKKISLFDFLFRKRK